jgi:hypothetical protein
MPNLTYSVTAIHNAWEDHFEFYLRRANAYPTLYGFDEATLETYQEILNRKSSEITGRCCIEPGCNGTGSRSDPEVADIEDNGHSLENGGIEQLSFTCHKCGAFWESGLFFELA